MSETLTQMPQSFASGTTITYLRFDSDHKASAGWALAVTLAGAKVKTVSSVASGDSFQVTFTATETAALDPGTYTLVERASKAGVVEDLELDTRGGATVVITPNVAAATAGSLQTFAEKALALIEARLSGRITADMDTFTIDGRAVSRIPMKELLEMRARFYYEVRQERNPTSTGVTHYVRFTGTGG